MILVSIIPCLYEVIFAFLWGDRFEDLADSIADGGDGSLSGLAQTMLELGKKLLDWVEVRRILGEEEQPGAGVSDGLAHGLSLVAAEIVDDDDIARS